MIGGRRWTSAEDKLIGTMPDEKLARRLNRTIEAVVNRRRHKGLWRRSPSPLPWNDKQIALLGKQAALKRGRSVVAVRVKRGKLHIPPIPRRHHYTPAEKLLMGTMMDKEVAKNRMSRSSHSALSRQTPNSNISIQSQKMGGLGKSLARQALGQRNCQTNQVGTCPAGWCWPEKV